MSFFRRLLVGISMGSVAAVTLAAKGGSKDLPQVYRNRIVAIVNDVPLTFKQMEEQLNHKGIIHGDLTEEAWNENKEALINENFVKYAALKTFERLKGSGQEGQVERIYNNVVKEKFGGDEKRLIQQLQMVGKSRRDYKKILKEEGILSFLYSQNVGLLSLISPREIESYYNNKKSEFIDPVKFNFSQYSISGKDWGLQNELLNKISGKEEVSKIKFWISEHPAISVVENRLMLEKDILPEIAEKLHHTENNSFASKPVMIGDLALFLFLKSKINPRQLSLQESFRGIEKILREEKWEIARKEWFDELKSKSFCKIL